MEQKQFERLKKEMEDRDFDNVIGKVEYDGEIATFWATCVDKRIAKFCEQTEKRLEFVTDGENPHLYLDIVGESYDEQVEIMSGKHSHCADMFFHMAKANRY